MANVSFYRQSTPVDTAGAITFDTTNKKIYLGSGTNHWTFDGNNTTYTFSAANPTLSWNNTSTVGTVGGTTLKVTMPDRPDIRIHNLSSTDYATNQWYAPVANKIVEYLNDSSSQYTWMIIDFTFVSWCGIAAFKDCRGVVSSARMLIPRHGWMLNRFDPESSGENDAFHVYSTPFTIASTNGTKYVCLEAEFNGSSQAGAFIQGGMHFEVPTNPGTLVSLSSSVDIGWTISYAY